MVDARKAEVFEGLRPEGSNQLTVRGADVDLTTRDLLEQILELFV
jgi:hypothetical protein